MISKLIRRYVEKTLPYPDIDETRREVELRHEKIGTAAARRFSRGNVSIQEGAFLLKDELEDTIQRRIKEYKNT